MGRFGLRAERGGLGRGTVFLYLTPGDSVTRHPALHRFLTDGSGRLSVIRSREPRGALWFPDRCQRNVVGHRTRIVLSIL